MSEERDLLANRREKMEKWQAVTMGYRNDFRRQHLAQELHDKYKAADKAELEALQAPTAISGRVMLRRVMGKASFITVQDVSGQIQC
jgi:lysyl-tRNA synthetase class 2